MYPVRRILGIVCFLKADTNCNAAALIWTSLNRIRKGYNCSLSRFNDGGFIPKRL